MAIWFRQIHRLRGAGWTACLIVATGLLVVAVATGNAAQFRRRPPAIPVPVTADLADLTRQFEKQLELGQFDEAKATLDQIERDSAVHQECAADTLRALGMGDLAKRMGKRVDATTAAECEQRRKQREDMKLRLGAARLQSRSAPEALASLYSRPPLFIEPGLSMTLDTSLMMALTGSLQRLTGNKALTAALMRASATLTENRLDAASEQYEQLIADAGRTLGDADPYMATLLTTMSVIDQRRGDFDRSLARVRSARAMLVKATGSGSPAQCYALWQEASILEAGARPGEARDAANACLSLSSEANTPFTRASALNNLGYLLHKAGDLTGATDLYQASLRIVSRPYEQPADAGMARSLAPQIHSNLGLAYWQGNQPSRAYAEFTLAQEAMTREGQSYQTEQALLTALSKLGAEQDVYITLERAAGPSGERARSIGLQMLLERKGRAIERRAQQTAAARELIGSPTGNGRGPGMAPIMAASARTQSEQYQTAVARRAALIQRRAASPEEAIELKRESDLLDAEIQFLESQLAQSAPAARGGLDPANQTPAYRAMLAEQEKEGKARAKELTKELRKKGNKASGDIYPTGAQPAMPPAMRAYYADQQRREQEARLGILEHVQAKLAPADVLLEMVRYRPFTPGAPADSGRWSESRYGTYVIRRGATPVFVDFGEAARLDEQVVEFRRALSTPRGTLAHDLGRRLDAALMQPIRARLENVEQLFVSPEGLLNLIPFGALVDEQDRYLIERFAFNYLSSGRDLLREPAPAVLARSAPMIVASPAYGEPAADTAAAPASSARSQSFGSVRFRPLPGTAGEAQALLSVLKGAVVLTGDRATETALKGVHRPRVLHIATHGFFLEDVAPDTGTPITENPMLRSGLALAGANRLASGADDGVLTALEAAALDLTGTQLVVLSACETGVGEIRNGEGVFGLRRALMAAGAETLVLSLWQVDDDATRQLMVEYHRRLASGEGRGEALRSAEIALLRDPAHRHPFYWASFISTGESSRMN